MSGVSSTSQGLARWLVPQGSGGEDLQQAFMAHPSFPAAMRRLSRNMVDMAASDRAFDGMAKDIGRYVSSLAAIYLDASGGITLPRLKEMCTQIGIASPGRARAILLYLRFLGYVVPAGDDGRTALYVPTKALLNAWQQQIRLTLEAASLVEPDAHLVSQRLSDPDYLRALSRIYGDGMLVTASLSTETPFMRIFLNPHAGMQLIHHLMLQADADDAYPPRRPVPLSIAPLSRQLHVSRAHIARLISAAEGEGMMARTTDDSVIFLEPAREMIRNILAVRLTQMLFCAARLEHERSKGDSVRPSVEIEQRPPA